MREICETIILSEVAQKETPCDRYRYDRFLRNPVHKLFIIYVCILNTHRAVYQRARGMSTGDCILYYMPYNINCIDIDIVTKFVS